MADDNSKAEQKPQKCPECPPPGAPGWMVTFSDMTTLLLTFFVLLLSFAKTETAKYEAALGSVRNAFGGNVLKHGEVVQRGKSADNAPTMMESQEIVRPFPIDFLTTEGFLDKHEINRESDEELALMRQDLNQFGMNDIVHIYEMPEGIKVEIKDKIYFEKGRTEIKTISMEALLKMINLLKNRDWTVFVQGHAGRGEVGIKGEDAFMLSAARAAEVSRALIKRGIRPSKISTVFYGDTRPDDLVGNVPPQVEDRNRRVEFMVRKRDLKSKGHKVDPR